MATFQKLRDYIEVNITQNLNYVHFKHVLNDMLDLMSVATHTYSGGKNVEITSTGEINLVADEYTHGDLQEGYEQGLYELAKNNNNNN